MSIKKKLVLGLLVFVSGLAAVVVTANSTFDSLDHGFNGIVASAESAVDSSRASAEDAITVAGEMEQIAVRIPQTSEDVQQTRLRIQILERKLGGVATTLAELVETIESTGEGMTEEEAKDELEWLADDATDLQETVRKEALIGLANASATMAASVESLGKEIEAIKTLTASLGEASTKSQTALTAAEEIAEASGGFQAEIATARRNVSAILGSIAFAAMVGMLLFIRYLSVSLRTANQFAEGITAGNLRQEIERFRSDEIGSLMRCMDLMQTSMRDSLESIERARMDDQIKTDKLGKTYARQRQQAEELKRASEEVSSAIDSIASASQEMSTTARSVSEQTAQVASMANQAVEHSSEATVIMEEMDSATNEIREIIQMITGIAQQTNLLAINATTEAVRAGEAGNGFAVVANEVKNLAEETGNATDLIIDRIATVEQKVSATGKAIHRIAGVIDDISEIQTSVAGAIEEQTATTSEITRNIMGAAQGSSDIVREVAALANASA